MGLSTDIVSQFAKLTTTKKNTNTETTVYGTTVMHNGSMYVQLDGSNLLTPFSTTADVKAGERVAVRIKNHSATVTGNTSSPAARKEDVTNVTKTVTEFEIVMAYEITADDLEVINANIENLQAKIANFTGMEAVNADIENLKAKFAEIDKMSASDMEVINADIENLKAKFGEFTDISTEDLDAINATINHLQAYAADFTYVSAEILNAVKMEVKNLDSKKLSAEEAELTYVNIDFSNIDKAWFGELYAQSGIIEDLTIKDGYITGRLVGVTIKGDLIEGNTIVADKLVIQGNDGLYYKLNMGVYDTICYKVEYNSDTGEYLATDEQIDNLDGSKVDGASTTDGDAVYVSSNNDETVYFYKTFIYNNEKVDVQEVPKNELDGKIIAAKSITTDKLKVTDLEAFGATIGGFNITKGDKNKSGAIYSGVKESVDNTTRGTYLDSEGQISIGDSDNYMRYYKTTDENGNEVYKLEIAADSVIFGKTGKTADDLAKLTDHVKIGTYTDPETGDDKPSVELTEDGDPDRLLLTNETIVFIEGEKEGTKIEKDKVSTQELEQGEFAWIARENGNYGLIFKGGI